MAEGTLTVCSDTPYEPFEMKEEDGTDTGFDMDLVARHRRAGRPRARR